MKNVLYVLLAFGLGFFLRGCISCTGSPQSNETDNIDKVDSLEIIQQAQAPLKSQVAQNEAIIADLTKIVKELREKERQGNKRAGELASIIEQQKAALEKERTKLQSLTVLLTETQADFQAVLKKQGVGSEVGEDLPTYSTQYTDPDDWFSLTGEINPNTEKADFNLNVRNEFVISDFVTSEGVAKFRVESRNPYSYVLPGTNTFEVPIKIERQKQRRFGLGFTVGAFAVKDFFSPDVRAGYGAGMGLFYRIF